MQTPDQNTARLGFYSGILLSIFTLIALVIGIFTPPIAGEFCFENCIEYPYLNIIDRYPRDYWWMFPAMGFMALYVIWSAAIHQSVENDRKSFSMVALCFAVISAAILLTNYFIQVSVIQASLVNGETEGIALLTQFNSHGIFIVLEDIGYITMGISFLFTALALKGLTGMERALKWILFIAFILMVASLVVISIIYGIHRGYIFEVTVILINWLTLITAGLLSTKLFRRTVNRY